jgi:hypothetical protein
LGATEIRVGPASHQSSRRGKDSEPLVVVQLIALEIKSQRGCNPAVTCAAADTNTTAATTTRAKSPKATTGRKALTKGWRRQVANRRIQIHAIEQVLKVQ